MDSANEAPVPDLPRAFTDASVIVSASISESGTAYDLFTAARQGLLTLIASTHALSETERNLYRKKPDALRGFWDLRAQLEVVNPPEDLVLAVARHVEPKDAAIVAATIAARATYLVTYDRRHLLGEADQLRRRYQIETVTPKELFTRLADADA